MKFVPSKDYFRKGNQILLTRDGLEKIKNIKLTGTKIELFFDLEKAPNEENLTEDELKDIKGDDENEPDKNTPYSIWSKIMSFPTIYSREPKKQERYRTLEDEIREYVNKLGFEFVGYPPKIFDVFMFEEGTLNENFGGVPDGEEMEGGKVTSILEIKTGLFSNGILSIDGGKCLNYLLQLGLYLSLRNLDVGYLAMCNLTDQNWKQEELDLGGILEKKDYSGETVTVDLVSYLPQDINGCQLEYTVLDYWDNLSSNPKNPVRLYKVRINKEKYQCIKDQLSVWFKKYEDRSPEMSPEELSIFLSKNKFS